MGQVITINNLVRLYPSDLRGPNPSINNLHILIHM
jgi:hypothetical protein